MKNSSTIEKWKIPLYKVLVDKEDELSVRNVIKRGSFWALGPEIENFEYELAKYVQMKYCLTFNSGTSALHAALIALGISNGNEVIVPSFTFISTVNSALMVNAKPKFCDIEPSQYGLDPIKLQKGISKKTRCVIPVHYAGLPCQINEIKKICNDNNIPLLEDAAESLGAKIRNKFVGSFGEISMFSFAGNKVLTTGEGGALVTNSKILYEKLKLIRSHGRDDAGNYFSSNTVSNYVSLGYNWRMSSITAALGLSQLSKLEKLIQIRRKHSLYLSQKLSKIDIIETPNEPKNHRHVFQLYSILLPNQQIRDKLMKFLTSKRIMTKIFFSPVHLTNFYQKQKQNIPLSITENISKRIVSLPMYPGMKKDDLDYICDNILEFSEILDT